MFIVFEGADGSGKSTHARLASEWMREKGLEVYLTCEPTDGKIGRFIREVLGGDVKVNPRTLSLLFTADRSEHADEIRKALGEGKVVLCDRYYHSTVAYQSVQGVEREWILKLNEFTPKPDLVIYFDLDSADAIKRAQSGEIFERQEFLEKVRKQYMRFDGLKVVETDQEVDEVQQRVRQLIAEVTDLKA